MDREKDGMRMQRGVIFQTVPEEVAQAIEQLAATFQLPPDRIVKLGVSFILLMQQTGDPMLWKMVDAVKRDHQRDVDRVLV